MSVKAFIVAGGRVAPPPRPDSVERALRPHGNKLHFWKKAARRAQTSQSTAYHNTARGYFKYLHRSQCRQCRVGGNKVAINLNISRAIRDCLIQDPCG